MGSQETEGVVVVAVSKHTCSIQAVQWTLSNKIVLLGSSLKLVHVRPVLRFIPTPKGDLVPENEVSPELVATYRRDLHSKTKQDLVAHKKLCDESKVQAELVIVEGDDIANSLLDQAFRLGATKFIIGKSKNTLLRRLKGRCIPVIIARDASSFCTVMVISKGKLVSVKDARASPHWSSFASNSSNHFLRSDYNISVSDVSSGAFLGFDSSRSSSSFSVLQASISDMSMMATKSDTYVEAARKREQQAVFVEAQLVRQESDIQAKNFDNAQRCKDAEDRAKQLVSNSQEKGRIAREEEAPRCKDAEDRANQFLSNSQERDRLAREEEGQRCKDAEDRANQLVSNSQEVIPSLQQAITRYRQYAFEELRIATNHFSEENTIGRGGYGRVYKGKLHHTTVAIKVLDKTSVQGPKEFQQEVEFLSHMHHPHIVLLLGACPEQGCLVYEYLANGSLADHLHCMNNAQPLPWHMRFRIAAEVATALLFLHSLMPNPYVHRDLKPANILLDQNWVSKVGDVGLAALAPSAISYDITQYKETIPVGTPAYIDPAYQRTGFFTPRSDVYGYGLIVLQLLTGRGPIGLPGMVEVYLNEETLEKVLDPTAGNWPIKEATELACIAIQCSKLEPRERTDLQDVLPRLEKLATFANDSMAETAWIKQNVPQTAAEIPSNFFCPISKVLMENPYIAADGFTYELAVIKRWLKDNKNSPKTNMKLQNTHLIPNHTLRLAILEWKKRLPSVWACQVQLV